MIKAGITGLGWWAQNRVRAGANSNIQFVASAVRDVDKSKEAAEKHGLQLYSSLDDLLANSDIDAVCVTTAHSQHYPDITRALEAGKHVLVEKPMCLTYADARKVTDLARDKGLILAVGHNRRFHPSIIELRKRIANGDLGTLLHITAYENVSMALTMPSDNWRAHREEFPVAGMTPTGMHQIDHVIDLCGRFEAVYAQSVQRVGKIDIDDTASVAFSLDTGMTGTLMTILATTAGMNITVFGTGGSAEIVGRPYGTLTWRPIEGDPEVIAYDGYDLQKDAVESEQQSFADAVEGKAPFHISPQDALHSVEVLQAMINSAESGQPVAISAVTG